MDNQTPEQPEQEQAPTSVPEAPVIEQATVATTKRSKTVPVLLVVGILLIVGVGFGVYSWQHSKVTNSNIKVANLQSQVTSLEGEVTRITTTGSATKKIAYPTLPPATVASKVATCAQALTTAADGTIGPLTCSGGDLNVDAWQYIVSSYAPAPPTVMTLGYGATDKQVLAAMCSDSGANTTKPKEEAAETIAALYYGWNFTTNPVKTFADQGC